MAVDGIVNDDYRDDDDDDGKGGGGGGDEDSGGTASPSTWGNLSVANGANGGSGLTGRVRAGSRTGGRFEMRGADYQQTVGRRGSMGVLSGELGRNWAAGQAAGAGGGVGGAVGVGEAAPKSFTRHDSLGRIRRRSVKDMAQSMEPQRRGQSKEGGVQAVASREEVGDGGAVGQRTTSLRALHAYVEKAGDELGFAEGEQLEGLELMEGGDWWRGYRCTDKANVGLFPANHCEVLNTYEEVSGLL